MHQIKMNLSCFTREFVKDLNKSKVSLSAEPKFDGLAISLTYRKGLFSLCSN
jgi:NAD-dependent DNA ligase (contains BRCT domain type II)